MHAEVGVRMKSRSFMNSCVGHCIQVYDRKYNKDFFYNDHGHICTIGHTSRATSSKIEIKFVPIPIIYWNPTFQMLNSCAIGEEQRRFGQGRGCMDQVFAVRQVCEKYLANGQKCILGVFGFGKGL